LALNQEEIDINTIEKIRDDKLEERIGLLYFVQDWIAQNTGYPC
jgi:hypothetical protein